MVLKSSRATAFLSLPVTSFGATSVVRTGTTEAVEVDTVVKHDESPARGSTTPQGAGRLDLQIEDAPAALAGEVVVSCRIAVIAAKCPAVQLTDQAPLREQLEIAVDRPEAKTRQAATHLTKDPVGGRMRVGAPNNFQNEPPLIRYPSPLAAKVRLKREIHI